MLTYTNSLKRNTSSWNKILSLSTFAINYRWFMILLKFLLKLIISWFLCLIWALSFSDFKFLYNLAQLINIFIPFFFFKIFFNLFLLIWFWLKYFSHVYIKGVIIGLIFILRTIWILKFPNHSLSLQSSERLRFLIILNFFSLYSVSTQFTRIKR